MVFEAFFKMSEFEQILRQGYAAAASGNFVSSDPVEEKRLVPRAAPRPMERSHTAAPSLNDDDEDEEDEDHSHSFVVMEEELEQVAVKISDIVSAAPAEPNRAATLRRDTSEFFHDIKEALARVNSILENTEYLIQNVPSRYYEQSLSLLLRRPKVWGSLAETLSSIGAGIYEFTEETIGRLDAVALAGLDKAVKEPSTQQPLQGVVRR